MPGELKIYDVKPLTVSEIKEQVQVIQGVLASVMLKDVHYGTIPGTPKPTLYKPGSEKILAMFHITAYPKEVEDLSTDDEIRYRVKVHGLTINGDLIGVGIGECSSSEEKYKWRKPACDEEFNETPESRKREVWKKGSPAYKLKQVRTNPADVANTILKMAKKRAQIDMTLTATAASDVFEQDLEDIPEDIRDGMTTGQQGTKTSTVKPGNGTPSTGDKKSARDTLYDELAAYCGNDQGAMQTVLKELTVFQVEKDGKQENVWMRVSGIKKPQTKETWIGKTIDKLREYVAAHPREEAPDTSWCCGDIEKCDFITLQGDNVVCGHEKSTTHVCDKL